MLQQTLGKLDGRDVAGTVILLLTYSHSTDYILVIV